MKHSGLTYAGLFLFLLLTFVGCKEANKLKSGGRKVTSGIKKAQSASDKLLKKLGVADSVSQNPDSLNNLLSPLEQKSFISNYSTLYDMLNGPNNNRNLQALEFDSASLSYKRQGGNQRVIREGAEVYTWYPYWMGDVWKTYDFNLISTISFFTYKIDPKTGSYINPVQINQWRQTDLLDSAKKHKTKVLLSLSLEGENNHLDFLKDEALWNTTLDSVAVLLTERDADGIELEFTDVPLDRETKFLDFVAFLKDNLDYRFVTKKMILSLVIPADDTKFPFDLVKLNESVDLFIVKGMDYHEIDGSVAAVAPLRNETPGGPSLETTVLMYLNRGLVAEKSILALPLYGSQWSGTYDPSEGYYSTNFERKVTLSEVNRVFQSKDSVYTIVPTLDETSMTNYFFLEFPDDTSIEGWYDDSTTLSKKMDLAIFNKFKGVGLYALGYDLGKEEIWNVVAQKFTGDIVYVKDPIKEIDGYPIKIAAFFQTYKQLFMVTFALVTLAMIIALVVAFSDWRFRETILARQLYRVIVLSITCLIFLLIFFVFGLLNEKNWSFFLFFLIGAIASYLVEKYGGLMKINKP
jgi:spore germination protein YaaH